MNLNKSVEVAVYTYTRRAGWSHWPSSMTAVMESGLAARLDFLRQHDVTADFLPVLEAGRRRLIVAPEWPKSRLLGNLGV
jgi:hypothetical protein